MTRKKKIELLQALKDGKISIAILQLPQTYIFIECSDKPGVYKYNDKEYSEQEYREFCESVRRQNNNSIIWEGEKQYLADNIITITVINSTEEN